MEDGKFLWERITSQREDKTSKILRACNNRLKKSMYRPGQALWAPGFRGFPISRQSAHEIGKVFSSIHRPSLPRRKHSWYSFLLEGWDSSVGIATGYGLDGSGIESRWGRDFPPVQNGPGAHPASYTMGTGSFPGVKRPGRGVDHPPHLAPRLKKE